MAKYTVGCTIIYNGSAEVEAESPTEAEEIVHNSWTNDPTVLDDIQLGLVNFSLGEITIDYADTY